MSTIKTGVLLTIVAGPSKFDLMTALFIWKPEHPVVSFQTEDGTTHLVRINSVSAEDGSGESWNIRGYAIKVGPNAVHRNFQMYFATTGRRGWIKYTD